jgi:hypothetical protein
MAKQSDGNELGINVPNQKCVVRGNLYQFHSKAATAKITFRNYISKDSSVNCCMLIAEYKLAIS